MRKRNLAIAMLGLSLCVLASGCKKKEEEPTGPVEQVLTAVSLEELESGNFYVKNGDNYWKLPLENCNFDLDEAPVSSDRKNVGFVSTGLEKNRIVSFVYEDDTIPTLYKNDTLVYISDDEISSFTWERFLDCGYSIGIYGFELNGSDKVTTGESSHYVKTSDIASGLVAGGLQSIDGLIVDKINGTPITPEYLNESVGLITGMSKNAKAEIDAFVGTTHVPVTASADTRYFQAFELYNSTQYSLSTDGYAMVEIPGYLKSGYYVLNNVGMVKFLNIDRGNDEASIDLTVPYFYKDADGKTLTYYEWREANGLTNEGVVKDTISDDTIDVSEYPEKVKLTIDSTAVGLNVDVNYSYKNESARQNASQTGEFPRAVLMDPYGALTSLSESETQNTDGSYTMHVSTNTAPSGDWYVLFRNFDSTYKTVEAEVLSGNANTYVHSGSSGKINIYYEGTTVPQILHLTWERQDRVATGIRIRTPGGIEYSLSKNPELFDNHAGGIDVSLPAMTEGSYAIELKGDALGRVWISREDSDEEISETETVAETLEDGTPVETTGAEETGESVKEGAEEGAEETTKGSAQ